MIQGLREFIARTRRQGFLAMGRSRSPFQDEGYGSVQVFYSIVQGKEDYYHHHRSIRVFCLALSLPTSRRTWCWYSEAVIQHRDVDIDSLIRPKWCFFCLCCIYFTLGFFLQIWNACVVELLCQREYEVDPLNVPLDFGKTFLESPRTRHIYGNES